MPSSRNDIDLAVHSLKDLPTTLPVGLTIAAICQRAGPNDVLVNRWNSPLADLPSGARIGTSSPRRAAQLKAQRPDIEVLPIRGNVETRLAKTAGDDYDGAVLAAAGIDRLGIEVEVAEQLPIRQFVPAPGQGALAVQIRDNDRAISELVAPLDHPATRPRSHRRAGFAPTPRWRLPTAHGFIRSFDGRECSTS